MFSSSSPTAFPNRFRTKSFRAGESRLLPLPLLAIGVLYRMILRVLYEAIDRTTRLPVIQLGDRKSYIRRGEVGTTGALQIRHGAKEHADSETAAAGGGLALDLPLGPVDSRAVEVAAPAADPVEGSVKSSPELIRSRGVHMPSLALGAESGAGGSSGGLIEFPHGKGYEFSWGNEYADRSEWIGTIDQQRTKEIREVGRVIPLQFTDELCHVPFRR